MKFKPIYLYGVIFIIVATILVVVTLSKSSNGINQIDVTKKQIPNDDVHKNLGIQQQNPTSANVSEEVFKKLQKLKELADAKPTDTLKIKEYADFLSAAHKPDEAIVYYEKILSIDNKRKDIYLAITSDYYNQGKLDKAEEITTQMLKFLPNDSMATYNLGAIEATKGNKIKARQIWMKLIKDFPNSETSELAKNSLSKL
jgi:tetratricopeptide (TPR) repeat protein